MWPHPQVVPTPPTPPLGRTCKGHSSPKAMEHPEHSTGKHQLCFLFYYYHYYYLRSQELLTLPWGYGHKNHL